jgi:hypothetical protein
MQTTLRMVAGTDDQIEGLAIPFGVADLYQTRFTPRTHLALDWFDERPVLYAHGLDEAIRSDPVGRTVEVRTTDKGVWVRAQLDKAHQYYQEIRELIDKGALGWSHGTLDYLLELGPAGPDGIREVVQWPVIEFTLTPTPANPVARVIAARDAGPTLRHLSPERLLRIVASRGWLPEGITEGDLDDEDFAWLSDAYKRGDEPPSAGRKYPYKIHGKVNEAGWKAAWNRVHQQPESAFAGGPSKDEVIRRLLRDKPEDVEVNPDLVPKGRSANLREGRRNSAADQERIQQIHDLAVELAALCRTMEPDSEETQPQEETEPVDETARPGEARSAEVRPRTVRLRVKADASELERIVRREAVAIVRELLGN